ncbi:MAG: response regulator [Mojavia pulchra JT2-VF2]|jgi:CheY-like chemotaxis protein|uniref:Response regulator n=1 Tax=Mojavia pulchra JT2-VF2 TaxID=287848 RepID=A0A951UJ64_9NOST|nr:response regulator [Mojavia pulchra JT2-VF2]
MNAVRQILTCDDVADDALLLQTILLADDCYVEIVDSGLALLSFLETSLNLPDLLILDINMPVMDGFEVITKIKQSDIFKNIPILVVTGLDENYIQENINKNIDLKIDGYIQKPINVDSVLTLVKNILSKARN